MRFGKDLICETVRRICQMKKKGNSRLALLDSLRGITLISMILYHACWDAVYILGMDWPWYRSRAGFVWQQSICWTFILLSGFCVPFSKRLLRRGLEVFAAGALVMLVTNLVLPEDRVIFGVLTLIGSCMLLMVPVRKMAENSAQSLSAGKSASDANAASKKRAVISFAVFVALFILFRDVNQEVIGTGLLHRIIPLIPLVTVSMPEFLYRDLFTAYLGFPGPGFYSTDYFSLLPWAFLYMCGYELHLIFRATGDIDAPILRKGFEPLAFLGRNSLLIYLLHQPVLYMFVLLYGLLVH